ncbi:MAG: hypothetical protein WAN27_12200, partial [Xanthobacteraceae bacterium]
IPDIFSPLFFLPLLCHWLSFLAVPSFWNPGRSPNGLFLADDLCRKQTRYRPHFQPDSIAAVSAVIAKRV